jgi:hypothetical protein
MTARAAADRIGTMTSTRFALAVLVTALVAAAPSGAAQTLFRARTFTEPATPGLAVSGALSGYAATATARVLVPTKWRGRSARPGRLRFAVAQNPSCHYDVTYVVTSALGADGAATDVVTAGLPGPGARYVLDSGARGNSAFRVVRQKSVGGRVRVDGLWAGVLTRRSDVAPAGQEAWARVRVTARSRAGDECHAGTWREALGPAIGDSLAVARAKLHFTRKG